MALLYMDATAHTGPEKVYTKASWQTTGYGDAEICHMSERNKPPPELHAWWLSSDWQWMS